MVARQQKKGFKTTVSIVSSNVLQKVVTIKNSCSHSASPNKKQVPSQVHIHRSSIREDLCCSPPIPLSITIMDHDDYDTTSEISCDLELDRPPTPRPPTLRKTLHNLCLVEPSSMNTTTCGIPTLPTSSTSNSNMMMDWPSDEEEGVEVENSPNKLSSVCGFDFWTPTAVNPNRWGLLIADRDEQEEGRREEGQGDDEDGVLGARTFSGSTYEYREPMVTLHDTSPFYTP